MKLNTNKYNKSTNIVCAIMNMQMLETAYWYLNIHALTGI